MGLQNWLFSVALTKVLKRVIQLIVSWLAAQQLDKVGVTVDPNQLTVGIYAGIELVRNFLKTKFGWKFL